MTPSEENAIAWGIRAAESEARQALARAAELDPEIDRLLRLQGRRGSTRAASVEGLEAAVALAQARRRPGGTAAARALERAREGRWQLVTSVIGVAGSEAWKVRVHGEVDDLRQEAVIGCYRATLRYDPAMGIRFSAYARWWARAGITRSIDKTGRVVRLPASLIEHRRNLLKLLRQAERAGLELSHVEAGARLGLAPDRVAELVPTLTDTVSMDATTLRKGEWGERRTLGDQLAHPEADVVDRIAAHAEAEAVVQALRTLRGREREVIVRYFGIGQERETLVEIGQSWGTTREWARRWKGKALAVLRQELARLTGT